MPADYRVVSVARTDYTVINDIRTDGWTDGRLCVQTLLSTRSFSPRSFADGAFIRSLLSEGHTSNRTRVHARVIAVRALEDCEKFTKTETGKEFRDSTRSGERSRAVNATPENFFIRPRLSLALSLSLTLSLSLARSHRFSNSLTEQNRVDESPTLQTLSICSYTNVGKQ